MEIDNKMNKKELKRQIEAARNRINVLEQHVYGTAKFVDSEGNRLDTNKTYLLMSDIDILKAGQRVTIFGFLPTGKTQSVTLESEPSELFLIALVTLKFTREDFTKHDTYLINILPEVPK